MESIKHKMDTMVKEKEVSLEKADGLEKVTSDFQAAGEKFEKEVSDIQRKIAKVEDELDITMTKTKENSEKLETADKEAIEAELQAGSYHRRLALLEEETARVKERLAENIEKTRLTETSFMENDEGRKHGEARSFSAEEALESMEGELEDANNIANESNHKYEDALRKHKVIEGDLERIIERAEEFETKIRETETQIRDMEGKVKETEAVTIKNADAEDKYESQIFRMQEDFKTADTR